MKVYEIDNNLIIEDYDSFVLRETFECGQCFRWDECDGGYIGVAHGRALKITEEDDKIVLHSASLDDWNSIWCKYFDMERDYASIKSNLSHDDILKKAISFGGGIRILNQDPFECLVSFIISASNNIPRIKKIIDSLCRNFGDKITYLGKDYYTFPTPERLASLSLEDLNVIKAGFRDKYILNAAKCVAGGFTDLESLKNASFEYAKTELLKLSGVGNKVADCVLLFSLEKYSSFPVDVWIKRIVEYCYFDTEQTNDAVSEFARQRFADLGGFAQQYLFYWARENKIGI